MEHQPSIQQRVQTVYDSLQGSSKTVTSDIRTALYIVRTVGV